MLQVFIGYDRRQPVAFQVAAHSVWQTAYQPVSITRLDLSQLPMTRRGLTEFTYSRFLVPWLSGFDGVSIFVDSDVLVRMDVAELVAYPIVEPEMPVWVVPHERKFERPSVMVFNNARCEILTPEYIENPAHPLLPLEWAASVGMLPSRWNHLVGYDPPKLGAKLVHFTQGIPVWPETQDCEFAAQWQACYRDSQRTVSFKELMGRSVHVPHMKVGA